MDATDILRYCPWVLELRRFVGQAEIPGPQTAPFILNWLRVLHTPWLDDESPWCGVAAAGCMEAVGLKYPTLYYRARSWVGFGRTIANGKAQVAASRRLIPYGALMVLDRPPRASDGHVGFYTGTAELSTGPAIVLLAGNQGNRVSYSTFPLSRVIYVGWPTPTPDLPPDIGRLLVSRALGVPLAPVSTGEA
jgi:uncharacterized protein (TIGR02594 family)